MFSTQPPRRVPSTRHPGVPKISISKWQHANASGSPAYYVQTRGYIKPLPAYRRNSDDLTETSVPSWATVRPYPTNIVVITMLPSWNERDILHNIVIRPNGDYCIPAHLDTIAFPPGYADHDRMEKSPAYFRRYLSAEYSIPMHSVSIGLMGITENHITESQIQALKCILPYIGNRYHTDLDWGRTVVDPSIWRNPQPGTALGGQVIIHRILYPPAPKPEVQPNG